MFWRTVGRLILIPIAFLLAAAAAAAVIVTLGLEHVTRAMSGTELGFDEAGTIVSALFQGIALASGLTILPALAVVIIGEVARIRYWLYYVVGGGISLALIPFLAAFGSSGTMELPQAIVWQVLATAGFCGGLVYWALAGRNA